jgi:tetratricopeptide (TPR) repeat protein
VIDTAAGDPEVEALVREERIIDAARLASARGDAHRARALYERACEWRCAALEAMRGGEHARALDLAALANDDALAERAARRVGSAAGAEGVAADLARRGQHAWAACVLEEAGHPLDAARAWERARHAARSAELFAKSGEPAEAARVLEAALRRDPHAYPLAVALGVHLARFGKDEGAIRALQRVPVDVPERRAALPPLVEALERLGLVHAAVEARAELARLGGPVTAEQPPVEERRLETPRALLFGRYEVLREVSSSSTARVIECVDVVHNRRVAVKAFAGWHLRGTGRDALARFEREARVLQALDHPNVVPVLDFVSEGPAIVVAWMAGGTLETALAQGPLAPARAVEIACALLSALSDAHRHGILHRDLKPANVLFDASGGTRLSDFGAAHFGDASTTATAGVIGTLAYMSPEQREGRPASARSDVFGAGVLLREMLTGERPAPRAVPQRPSEAHLNLDGRHDEVVAWMTAPEVERRPADAREAREALFALAWPSQLDLRRKGDRADGTAKTQPHAGRLEFRPDGKTIDVWLQSPIERVPLPGPALPGGLARARAFAAADHPALQMVLRVDREEGVLWLSVLLGHALDRPLTVDERVRLAGALSALHAAGASHGSVDEAHILVDGHDGAMLRFEGDPDASGTYDGDRVALERLGQPAPSSRGAP